jgi:hypothetical protein
MVLATAVIGSATACGERDTTDQPGAAAPTGQGGPMQGARPGAPAPPAAGAGTTTTTMPK